MSAWRCHTCELTRPPAPVLRALVLAIAQGRRAAARPRLVAEPLSTPARVATARASAPPGLISRYRRYRRRRDGVRATPRGPLVHRCPQLHLGAAPLPSTAARPHRHLDPRPGSGRRLLVRSLRARAVGGSVDRSLVTPRATSARREPWRMETESTLTVANTPGQRGDGAPPASAMASSQPTLPPPAAATRCHPGVPCSASLIAPETAHAELWWQSEDSSQLVERAAPAPPRRPRRRRGSRASTSSRSHRR